MAGLPDCADCWLVGGLALCFCSYQANISVEKASPSDSLESLLSLATAGTASTGRSLGRAGNSGRTDSREVEERWEAVPDPDLGLSGESDSVDLRLLALALRNLLEYL